jgi:hypothetical protein
MLNQDEVQPIPGSHRYHISDGSKEAIKDALGIQPGGTLMLSPSTMANHFQLIEGAVGRICYTFTQPDSKKADHSCTRITVQEPVFQSAWIAPPGTHYVIFGALAPDTLNGLSTIDTDWYESSRKDVGHRASVNDPASALLQAMRAYNTIGSATGHPSGVVLAQMPPSEAKALADSLGSFRANTSGNPNQADFAIIFSAADPVEASPKMDVTINDPQKPPSNSADEVHFIPVFTPAPVFQSAACLTQPDPSVCLARVSEQSAPEQYKIQLANVPATNIPAAINSAQRSTVKAWTTPFCADQASSNRLTTWECKILSEMRSTPNPFLGIQNRSDIAILEEKDFDLTRLRGLMSSDQDFMKRVLEPLNTPLPYPTPEPDLDAAAGTTLWKAGRLTRISLLGSTLSALLQQNDKLETMGFQTLPETRKQQQLKIIGITKEGENYFVNGILLNPSQIYSVATSDRLATATSDYPQLAQADLQPPENFPFHKTTVEIATIVKMPQPYPESSLEAPEGLPAAKAPNPKAVDPPYSYSSRTLNEKQASSVLPQERAAQDRPLLRMTLEQLATSFSRAAPSQQDQYIGGNLGGVTNPNVSAAYSRSVSVVQNGRAELYLPERFRHFTLGDLGIDELVNVAESVQGTTTVPTVTMTTANNPVPEQTKSLTANTYTIAPFAELQLPPHPQWKFLVGRWIRTDNLLSPAPQFLSGCPAGKMVTIGNNPPSTCGSTSPAEDLELRLHRSYSNAESIGTRFEASDFRYFEAGFTHQRSYDVLSAVGVSGVATSCQLSGSQSLQTCAELLPAISGDVLSATYSNYTQYGGYMLFLWTQPLGNRFVLQPSGFGNFYAYGNQNQSTLTHYAINGMLSVLVSLPANFSIGPTVSEFWFQSNASHIVGASLTRNTIGAQLNYNFDWHSGVSRREFSGSNQ